MALSKLQAARLLTRLWAPAAGRVGRGPWQIGRTFTLASDDPRAVNTNDDNLTARAGVRHILWVCKAVFFGGSHKSGVGSTTA